jgi:hypothetical protein
MKSVLIKIIPYIAAFILINVALYSFSGFYKQEKKYVQRIDDCIKNQSETIFLGDSHVEAIKLIDLSNTVGNLAFGADGIYEMYVKTLIMLEKNSKLSHVFIATEPQLFNNTGSSNSTFLGKYMINLTDTLNVYEKSKLNLITDRVPLFNDGFIGYTLNSVYESFKPETTHEAILWSSLNNKERKEIAQSTGKSDHRDLLGNTSFLKVYKALVEMCKTNGIKVIGIRFPVNKHYIEQCSKEDLTRINEFIASLDLEEHLDYSTSITDPSKFADEDHLNRKGIERLAEMIEIDTGIKIIQ